MQQRPIDNKKVKEDQKQHKLHKNETTTDKTVTKKLYSTFLNLGYKVIHNKNKNSKITNAQ